MTDVRRGSLPGRAWRPVGHGLQQLADAPADARLRAWQLVLPPDGAFTGLTAAAHRGWWLPPLPPAPPVFAVVPAGALRIRRRGLVVQRSRLIAYDELGGVRLRAPAACLLDATAYLGTLDVALLAESAVASGACGVGELEQLTRLELPGSARLRRALRWVDGRAESAWEVLLRIHHESAGIAVVPQHEVHDAAGRFIARGDLWLVGTNEIHEYDGAGHRDPVQHRSDLSRDRRLADEGMVRRGYTSYDLLRRPTEMLREADAAVGRAHDPRRGQRWQALLRDSLFTHAGTARFWRRVGHRADGSTHRTLATDGQETP